MLIKAAKQITNATRYSMDGLWFMLRSEFSARLEFYIFFWTMILFAVLKVPSISFLIAVILFLLLLAMESVNTAIEVIIDRVSPERSDAAKQAKDLGSFAVMCLLISNLLYGFYVIYHSNFVQGVLA